MIKIDNVKLLFPAVYNSRRLDPKYPARYNVAFSGEEAEQILEVESIFPKEKLDMRYFNASSGYPPLVTCKNDNDYETLLRAVQFADARNMRRDMLLSNLEKASVIVKVYEYDQEGYKGRALSIEQIIVNPKPMLVKALAPREEK